MYSLSFYAIFMSFVAISVVKYLVSEMKKKKNHETDLGCVVHFDQCMSCKYIHIFLTNFLMELFSSVKNSVGFLILLATAYTQFSAGSKTRLQLYV